MNIVDRAKRFAERAHRNQKRKYTHEPYFVHLHEVANLVAASGAPKRVVAAAYLHDSIEDQPVTYDQLRSEFGREVADLVVELTDEPHVEGGPSRQERKLKDLDRLASASAEAQTIKCADLISNTSSIVRHDKNFARKYLPEKRAALTVMTRADEGLRAKAWAALVEAEKQLDA